MLLDTCTFLWLAGEPKPNALVLNVEVAHPAREGEGSTLDDRTPRIQRV